MTTSGEGEGGIICNLLPSEDYDVEGCLASSGRRLEEQPSRRVLSRGDEAIQAWDVDAPLRPNSSQTVLEAPNIEVGGGVTSTTLRTIIVRMRSIVGQGSASDIAQEAAASGDIRAAVGQQVLAALVTNVADSFDLITSDISFTYPPRPPPQP